MSNVQNIITEFLKTEKTFFIAAPKNSSAEVTCAKDALRRILLYAEKKIYTWPDPQTDVPSEIRGIIPKKPHNTVPSQITISIPKSIPFTAEYDQQETKNVFILTSEKKLNRSDIETTEHIPKTDVGFLFCSPEYEFDHSLHQKVQFPSRENMVFFTRNTTPLSQKIFESFSEIENIDIKTHTDVATLLYASLVYETKNFRDANAETFGFAQKLLENGAQKDELKDAFDQKKSVSYAHIFGRALARTQIDQKTSSSWTFLKNNDIGSNITKQRAEQSADRILKNILEEVRETLPQTQISFLLWQAGENIHAISIGGKEVVKHLSRIAKKPLHDTYILFTNFSTFSEAELHLRELLKQIK